MFEPFSRRARPWEKQGAVLRRLAGIDDGTLLDPWQLASKVGLTVMDGATALELLALNDSAHLRGPASRLWSGGVLPESLPDGTRLCILNPLHEFRRNKITLMEEITHSFLNHRPTTITLHSGPLDVRDFNEDQEAEAYGVGAAALVPWPRLFRLLNEGASMAAIAEDFEVSVPLVSYRTKITGAYRLYSSRQRNTA